MKLYAKGVGNALVDLVPRQRLIAHDLERLANGFRVAEQTDEATCKVFVPRECPKRTAIALYDDRLSVNHALQHLPATFQSMHAHRHRTLTIGVARADDGDGEGILAVFLH